MFIGSRAVIPMPSLPKLAIYPTEKLRSVYETETYQISFPNTMYENKTENDMRTHHI